MELHYSGLARSEWVFFESQTLGPQSPTLSYFLKSQSPIFFFHSPVPLPSSHRVWLSLAWISSPAASTGNRGPANPSRHHHQPYYHKIVFVFVFVASPSTILSHNCLCPFLCLVFVCLFHCGITINPCNTKLSLWHHHETYHHKLQDWPFGNFPQMFPFLHAIGTSGYFEVSGNVKANCQGLCSKDLPKWVFFAQI